MLRPTNEHQVLTLTRDDQLGFPCVRTYVRVCMVHAAVYAYASEHIVNAYVPVWEPCFSSL